jgi:hypothetical protein
MKQILTFLPAFLLVAQLHLSAQNTGDDIFVLDLKIDNQIITYQRGPCGFSAPDNWGGPVDSNYCLPIVWGYSLTDSLGCAPLIQDYTGKMVMLRRGGCEYGTKALHAQQAGAAAMAVANGYGANHGDACNAPVMGSLEFFQVTIPSLLFCRNMVDVIDNALKAGKQPELCFRRLNLFSPTAEYAYAVPVAQADTLDLISVRYVNRTGINQDFTAKAIITDPAGAVTELTSSQFISASDLSTFYFPEYVPPPLVGKFKVAYFVEQNNQVGDTLYREFQLTPHTFATDNFQIIGGEPFDQLAEPWFLSSHSTASLIKTGDTSFVARWASFGIHNSASVAVADPFANVVNLVLYDADPDSDGINDLATGLTAFDVLPFIAYSDYTFDANLKPDSILNVELIPVAGDKVILKPNHYYYLRLIYNGIVAGTGLPLAFTCSSKVTYEIFSDVGPVTPLILDDAYADWDKVTVVARLNDENYDLSQVTTAAQGRLGKWQYAVTPNPANDRISLNLNLSSPNQSVNAMLLDLNGRIVASQTVTHFQNGQIHFDSRGLPSGHYGLLIRAGKDGSSMTNLMICH